VICRARRPSPATATPPAPAGERLLPACGHLNASQHQVQGLALLLKFRLPSTPRKEEGEEDEDFFNHCKNDLKRHAPTLSGPRHVGWRAHPKRWPACQGLRPQQQCASGSVPSSLSRGSMMVPGRGAQHRPASAATRVAMQPLELGACRVERGGPAQQPHYHATPHLTICVRSQRARQWC
jgi:hypothetical protein